MRIVVRQMSGLGNQMFQYAAGLYYARKYGADLEIAIDSASQASSQGFPRPYQLSQFGIPISARETGPLERLMQTWNPRLRSTGAVLRKLFGTALIEEPGQYCFHPDLPGKITGDNIYIRGYWQAAQYAESVGNRLRSDLVLRKPASGKDAEVLRAIKNSATSVSLHLRRGDYLLRKEGSYALSLAYYHDAIRTVQESGAKPSFFIFSDDIAFARKNLPRDIHAIFVDHNDAWTGYEDLRLMSACTHNIIANSSFSWWAAWLNPNREKIVIAPKYWLCKIDSYFPDLFPPNWTLIDNL